MPSGDKATCTIKERGHAVAKARSGGGWKERGQERVGQTHSKGNGPRRGNLDAVVEQRGVRGSEKEGMRRAGGAVGMASKLVLTAVGN